MKKNFTEEIVEVLENSKHAMTAEQIAEKLSEKLSDDYSVNPKKVKLRVKENSELFSVQNGLIELAQKRDWKYSLKDLTSRLSQHNLFYSSQKITSKLIPSLFFTYGISNSIKSKDSFKKKLSNISLDEDPLDIKAFLYDYFKRIEDELSDKYKGHKQFFGNVGDALDRIESDELLNLLKDFSELDFSDKDLSDRNFAEIYSHFIDYLGKTNKREQGEYLPDEIYSFVSDLVKTENASRVYSPILTSANFFSKVHRHLFGNRNDVYFCGHVESDSFYYLTLQNFISSGHDKFDLHQEDALEDSRAENFDLAIAQLPLGRKKPKLKEDLDYLIFGTTRSLEWYYVQKMLHSTKKGGRVISIMGGSALHSLSDKKIRNALLKEGLVEAVIRLPKNVFSKASISPYILILDKDRKKDTIFMADFAQETKSFSLKEFQNLSVKVSESYREKSELDGVTRHISQKEIMDKDSSLNPANFIHPELGKVKEFLNGDDKKVLSVKEIVKDHFLGRFRPDKEQEIEKDDEWFYYKPVKYISARDLSKQRNLVDLRLSGLKSIMNSSEDEKKKRSIIKSKAVLVSLFNDLNPIVFTPSEENPYLVVGNNVLALFPAEEKISAEYLHYQLSQEITQIQIELKQGGVVPRTNVRDLLDTKIFVPEEKEQRKEIFEFKKSLLDKEESEEEFKQKEKIIMANMRHSLKNQIGPIRNDFETTKLFLDKLQESGDKFSWDSPIRPATREEDEVKSVSQVFKRIDRKFDELNDIMDKMKAIINLNKAKLNLEFVQVGKLIREVYDSLNLDPENTLIKCEGSKIEAPLDVFWFREAISNLIINADRHGRIEEKQLELYFEISKTENEKVRIYYANNGKPLPSEFDFETQFKGFKEKAGSEAGSGLGGYLINKVFESHEGSIHLIEGESNDPSLYNVEMEILIPRRI